VLHGVRGYLATITSAQEQAFVFRNIAASDIWIGASDDHRLLNAALGTTAYADQSAAEGAWHWVVGPEAGTRFWQGQTSAGLWIRASDGTTLPRSAENATAARYENWCPTNRVGDAFDLVHRAGMSEPNDWNGSEHFALEKWGGAACWNDFGADGEGRQTGYLVEYSEDWGTGAAARGSFSGSTATAEVTLTVAPAPAPEPEPEPSPEPEPVVVAA
jgi:hypothetical protein